jgi:hypothetical protein
LGCVLHVNVSENGTPYQFFKLGPPTNPNYVCPNWQIYKSAAAGGVYQMLPVNWQSWCQADGNGWGPSIETAGMVDEPLTPYQIDEIGKIYKIGHDEWGWPYQITDSISRPGLGTHAMGGAAWGGHPCPGTLRASQRKTILAAAQGVNVTMPTAHDIAVAVLTTDGIIPAPDSSTSTNKFWSLASHVSYQSGRLYQSLPSGEGSVVSDAELSAGLAPILAGVAALKAVGVSDDDLAAAKAEILAAIASVTPPPAPAPGSPASGHYTFEPEVTTP